jgi:DMSO/TMAO reductase YedYZ molybdopterin-dependent catalytic subunit
LAGKAIQPEVLIAYQMNGRDDIRFAYWDYADGQPVRRPLGEMRVKSEITRPAVYERLAANQAYTITGASWAGETEIARVAVSMDGGGTWAEAEFLDPARLYAWRRWKLDWITTQKTGQYTLMARAEDALGQIQPDRHDPSYGS